MTEAGRRRTLAVAYYVVLAALALRLFLPAAALAFAPTAARDFAQTGLPSWVRPALAGPELVGAVLILVPATYWWGAALLGAALLGAIAAHGYLHLFAWRLGAWLVLLGMLGVARRWIASTRSP